MTLVAPFTHASGPFWGRAGHKGPVPKKALFHSLPGICRIHLISRIKAWSLIVTGTELTPVRARIGVVPIVVS
jgi:hypothetical protein